MDTTDLQKLRRFSLTVAVVLATLVLADVKLDTPVRVAPLGIPMTIERPDLLTVGLLLVAFYTSVRYIYFGMLVHASPMRVRRELATRSENSLAKDIHELEAFRVQAQKDIDRYFPRVGSPKVTFDTVCNATGCHLKNLKVPRVVKIACLIEDIDFLLPIFANVSAISFWCYAHMGR